MKQNLFQLEEGERLNRSPNKPIIHFVDGEHPYLWIGNNNHREQDRMCFATLSDKKKLRGLARRILESIKE